MKIVAKREFGKTVGVTFEMSNEEYIAIALTLNAGFTAQEEHKCGDPKCNVHETHQQVTPLHRQIALDPMTAPLVDEHIAKIKPAAGALLKIRRDLMERSNDIMRAFEKLEAGAPPPAFPLPDLEEEKHRRVQDRMKFMGLVNELLTTAERSKPKKPDGT